LWCRDGTDKAGGFDKILAAQPYAEDEVAYMGDDLLDLPVLRRVGLATSPADATSEVQAVVHWISRHPGGRGAVRELVELILRRRADGQRTAVAPGVIMLQGYGVLLGVLVALLAGPGGRQGVGALQAARRRWIDRRRVRQSPHFILGLNYLVAGQVDLAIENWRTRSRSIRRARAALVLGNLYREKGQVGRAIQSIRRSCSGPASTIEHANVLLCLGSTTAAAASSIGPSRRSRTC
jgi:hypothetical protein